ncbi:MAG: crossover junction endodeoxyribonuclease RuvC [Cyanobacteria bacterium NC_groundwater_1444_Ag_S-0.65um_54_12]|nr:crossover junction endodeoxyribonuclease RuvC [Cyanobacteria bacterium NC_groundwater_1444_Ag_S-0.65um_54_12]
MLILGVDPGTATVGYGLIAVLPRKPVQFVAAGSIITAKGLPLSQRLKEIHFDLSALIAEYRPTEMAVEELFFVRNITTGIQVAMARGVICLAGAQAGLEVAGYTPMVVKQSVTGHGRSDKRAVQEAIRELLNLETIPRPDDAADALAIALCHFYQQEATMAMSCSG